jgi:hypothetical protein
MTDLLDMAAKGHLIEPHEKAANPSFLALTPP